MTKILSDHRMQMGNFEFLDFPDEAEVAALRDKLAIDAPMDLSWTWDYGSEVAELRQLYEKGKTAQWNATTDLDWEIPVSRDEWVIKPDSSLLANVCKLMGKDEATQKAAAFDELGYLLSQLLHGEQAALQLCGQLTNVCDKMDQKFYAASQTIDEARHIEVMSRFLAQKNGNHLPGVSGAEAFARHAASGRRDAKEIVGNADPLRGDCCGNHGFLAYRFLQSPVRRDVAPGAAGRIAPRGLWRSADAAAGSGSFCRGNERDGRLVLLDP